MKEGRIERRKVEIIGVGREDKQWKEGRRNSEKKGGQREGKCHRVKKEDREKE